MYLQKILQFPIDFISNFEPSQISNFVFLLIKNFNRRGWGVLSCYIQIEKEIDKQIYTFVFIFSILILKRGYFIRMKKLAHQLTKILLKRLDGDY